MADLSISDGKYKVPPEGMFYAEQILCRIEGSSCTGDDHKHKNSVQ